MCRGCGNRPTTHNWRGRANISTMALATAPDASIAVRRRTAQVKGGRAPPVSARCGGPGHSGNTQGDERPLTSHAENVESCPYTMWSPLADPFGRRGQGWSPTSHAGILASYG